MKNYQIKIGLEVHVQLATKTKMFCGCTNDNENTDPNTLICPICLGYPGTLPVINEKAIELAGKTALALGCAVQEFCRFDRKNYFYPDLPKGYQITQFFYPIGLAGQLAGVGIERVHLEEDTAKLVHAGQDSLIDYNRAGIPLLEIVSQPDITSPEQAGDYLKKIRDVLVRGGYSTARMQLGEFRCDANISTLDEGGNQLGEVVEIKNLNSFRNVTRALAFEFGRQIETIERGEKIRKETRGFDANTGETYSQRIKEKAHDYRYFPEPDLPPLIIGSDLISVWRSSLVVSETDLFLQLKEKYGFDDDILAVLVKHENEMIRLLLEDILTEMDDLSDESVNRRIVMFVLGELWTEVKNKNWELKKLQEKNKQLVGILNQYGRKETDKSITKDLIEQTLLGDKDAVEIIGGRLESNDIVKMFEKFVLENPQQVELFKRPEKRGAVENFFVGFVKRQNHGRGDVVEILKTFRDQINK